MTATATPIHDPAGPAFAPAQPRLHAALVGRRRVSLLGTATTSIPLLLLAVVTTNAGPAWMESALAAATWLPWLVVGLPAGAWVDRLPAQRVMIAADLAAAAALLSVPGGLVFGRLSQPQLLGVALLVGTATVFFRAAYPVFLTSVVPLTSSRRPTRDCWAPSRRCRSPGRDWADY